jgi:hypothetical protein
MHVCMFEMAIFWELLLDQANIEKSWQQVAEEKVE